MAKKSPHLREEIKLIDDFFKEGIRIRDLSEREMLLNLAYFEGKQWVRWNPSTKTIYKTPRVPHKERITYNKIKPKVKEFVSLVNSRQPQYEVVPLNKEDKCVQMAEFTEGLVHHIEDITDNDLLNIKNDTGVSIFGTHYKMVTWSLNKGTVKSDGTRKGDIAIEVLSPFHIVKQAGVDRLDDSKRVMILKFRSYEWIKDTFPQLDKKILEKINKGANHEISESHKSLIDIWKKKQDELNITDDTGNDSKPLLIKTLLELPSKKYPKGRMLVGVDEVLLTDEDLPYDFMIKDGVFNIEEFNYDVLAPTQPYPRSMVSELRQPQKHFNMILSLIQENFKLTAKSKLLIPKNAGVSKGDIHAENGVMYYMPTLQGHKPSYESAGAINADVWKALKISDDSLTELSIGKTLSGDNPENVRAAGHYQALFEQNQRILSSYLIHKERKEGSLMKKAVKLLKEKYDEKRIIQLRGIDNTTIAVEFKKASVDFLNLKIIKGSTFPESKAAQTQYLVTLAQTAQDPQIMQAAMQNLGHGNINRTVGMQTIDSENAIKDIQKLEQGLPVEVMPFDNHQVHAGHLIYAMKTESFKQIRQLPMQVPVTIPDPRTGKPIQTNQITRGQYGMMILQQRQQFINQMREQAIQEQLRLQETTQNIKTDDKDKPNAQEGQPIQ